MARQSRGFVELVWICPNCETKNPGPIKVCQNCGAPQPEDVPFIQDVQAEIIKEKERLAHLKASGPDIHCFYCGTRNPSQATTCSQCGADLTAGHQRQAGQVVGAYDPAQSATVDCPSCGTENTAIASQCRQCGTQLKTVATPPQPALGVEERASTGLSSLGAVAGGMGLIGLGVVACIVVGLIYFLFLRTTDMTGTVASVFWERVIIIEEQRLVDLQEEAWQDNIPAEAQMGDCTEKIRTTQDEPPPEGVSAREVCGTPYTIDRGDGYGEVVQDCEYELYDDWCDYTLAEWQWVEVDQTVLQGYDLNPQWPIVNLGPKQQEGERRENYEVMFNTNEGQMSYTPRSENQFVQFRLGSEWVLKVNALGGIQSVETQ